MENIRVEFVRVRFMVRLRVGKVRVRVSIVMELSLRLYERVERWGALLRLGSGLGLELGSGSG